MLLKYKTVMMTGGASGIGRATVLMLAKEGARVLLCDVNEAGANETIKMARRRADRVRQARADRRRLDRCLRQGGARSAPATRSTCSSTPPAGTARSRSWRPTRRSSTRCSASTCVGPVRLTRALFPAMMAGGGGKIVFVACDAGRVGSLGETPYSAAKGGIIGFTKSLAREGARHKITVNCVCPGPTDTPLFHANPERMREALLKAIPFRRLASPDDIAGAILYFAGPDQRLRDGPDPLRQRRPDDGGLGLTGRRRRGGRLRPWRPRRRRSGR